ncbi:MAG: SPFH domain-containing protein, partial [Achromobacter spanius]
MVKTIGAVKPRNIKVAIITGLLFLLILFIAFGSWFQVDQGERGVVLRNGKLVRVSEPGLDFKTPFIDNVMMVSVRDHTFVFEKLEAYSYDQQPAQLRVSVTYRVPPEHVAELYSEYGTIDNLQMRVLERKTPDAVKNVFGQYTAVRAIQERQKLGLDVNTAVLKTMDGAPVQVVGVQIEEVGFSQAYEHSIEQRMLAQVQIETTRQQKETAMINAEIQVVKARAEADARRQQFTAEADGIRMRGEAEAASIRAKAEALAANTNLVSLNAVEKWD